MNLLRTLILRFAQDFVPDIDTIEPHRAIYETQGSTWWGWFARPEEVERGILALKALKAPVTIGLFEKRLQWYFLAECQAVAFNEDCSSRKSPAEALTPSYYRDRACPAWFQLTNIKRVTINEFGRKFGGIPKGSRTLFPIIERSGTVTFDDSRQVVYPQPIDVEGEWILHLSDIHCGDKNPYPVKTAAIGELPKWSISDIICRRIESLGYRVGLLIASGDFTYAYDKQGFEQASVVLADLCSGLGLERSQVLMVPGNHDLARSEITEPFDAHYRAFRNAFYNVGVIDDIEEFRQYHFQGDGWTVRCVGLNSARNRGGADKEHGLLGPLEGYKEYLDYLVGYNEHRTEGALLLKEHILNVAVLHHHLKPTYNYDQTFAKAGLILDAFEAEHAFVNAGIHCILHGHQHKPFISQFAVHSVMMHSAEPAKVCSDLYTVGILGAGSAGAPRDSTTWGGDNSFSLYRPSDDRIEVQIEDFHPGAYDGGAKTLHKAFLPLGAF